MFLQRAQRVSLFFTAVVSCGATLSGARDTAVSTRLGSFLAAWILLTHCWSTTTRSSMHWGWRSTRRSSSWIWGTITHNSTGTVQRSTGVGSSCTVLGQFTMVLNRDSIPRRSRTQTSPRTCTLGSAVSKQWAYSHVDYVWSLASRPEAFDLPSCRRDLDHLLPLAFPVGCGYGSSAMPLWRVIAHYFLAVSYVQLARAVRRTKGVEQWARRILVQLPYHWLK